ncbi:putative phage lysis holin [Selenomonas ruminantium subsp. lactilytica TAM6421]|uniref:Putative phage lysis holin n=2 Tax=Selenomonas ruminantium TaxID=971 RepID=I0GRY0_SELRL|nr:putative phage lysis holin [Selenomonas ruminantium subsp. lactilytica TAM6421]
MVLDYLTGVVAAYINPDLALNSQRGFKGIAKKAIIMFLVSLAYRLDCLVGKEIMQYAVMWFFISNESLSIIENAAKAGVPIPTRFKESLEQLAKEKQAR